MAGHHCDFLSVCVFLLVIIHCVVDKSWAEVIGFGPCPTPGLKANFNKTMYTGDWYQFLRFPHRREENTECVVQAWSLGDDGELHFLSTGFKDIKLFGQTVARFPLWVPGTTKTVNSAEPARFQVSYDIGSNSVEPADFLVVDTDYTTYSVVFACMEVTEISNIQAAWILTRIPGVPPPNLEDIKANLLAAEVETRSFRHADQSNCRRKKMATVGAEQS